MNINLTVTNHETGSSLAFDLADGDSVHALMPDVITARLVPDENAPRLLADIIADVVRHGRENPGHGSNCACMDKHIREIRTQVFGEIPADGPPSSRLDARWRISHVLNAMLRTL